MSNIGRKRQLIGAALLYLLGSAITATAPELAVLLAGRLIYGLGIGLAMHGAPLYIAETCPSQIRGTLVSLKELFIVLGILVYITLLPFMYLLSTEEFIELRFELLSCSWVILWEAFRLVQLVDGDSCMDLVLHLLC